MWLERLTLVLLSVTLVISGPVPVILDYEPRRVEVLLGSSVAFQCRLKTQSYDRFRVQWIFSPSPSGNTTLLNNSINVLNQTQQDSRDEGTKGTWPTYTLANATEEQGGCYYCKIIAEIPVLDTTRSNTTRVVIRLPPPSQLMERWMWISLGVSSVLLVVLLLICVSLSRRRCRRRGEEPVYANTRPVTSKQPSPRPGSDHLKEPSSLQNIRKPSPCRKYNEGKRRYK